MPVKVVRTLPLLTIVVLASMAGVTQAQIVEDAALRDIGLSTYWRAQLPLAADDAVVQSFLVDEALYITTKNGTIFSLVANAGLIRWAEKVTERNYTIYAPSHAWTADGTGPVIVTTTTQIYILDRYSGELINAFRPDFPAGGAAIGADYELYLGSANSMFYSLAWKPQRGCTPIKRWEVRSGGPISAAPQFLGGDSLVFASQSGYVFSCTTNDKALNWSYPIGQAVVDSLVVDETGVYAASVDRSLYKINASNGRLIWRHRMPSPLRRAPVVVDQTVYQFCQNFGLAAINRDTGREIWHYPEGVNIAAQDERIDFVFAHGPALVAIDRENGQAQGRLDLTGVHHATTNAMSDHVYLIGHQGYMVCARPSSVSFLRKEAVAQVKERLTLPPLKHDANSHDHFPASTASHTSNNDPLKSGFDANR